MAWDAASLVLVGLPLAGGAVLFLGFVFKVLFDGMVCLWKGA